MADARKSPAAAPKSRIWIRVILAVSLGLNLLVVGAITGARIRGDAPPSRESVVEQRAMQNLGFGPFLGALPADQRREIGRELRGRAGSYAHNREALAGEFRTMLEILRSEPFDPIALNALLDRQKSRIDSRAQIGRDLLVEKISAMSPDERGKFVDSMERMMRRALERVRR